MNGRVYDPVLARFLSPDPYVQAPDYTQNFNRYSYCYNNPFKYTDPSGELQIGPFYVSLNLGWGYGSGFYFGISAGVGIEGGAYAGISIGYNTSGSFSFSASAGIAGFYVSGGYDTKGGWNASAGWSAPIPPIGGIVSINTNMLGVSGSYSQNGGWSYNHMGVQISKSGVSFNPSAGVGLSLKWGKEVLFYYGADNDLVSYENSPLKGVDSFVEYYQKQGYEAGKYGMNSINYTGEVSEGIIRDADGIMYEVDKFGNKTSRINGVTINQLKGLKVKSDVYLSPHATLRGFDITMRHEHIHVYHFNKYGLGYQADSEYVAKEWTRLHNPYETNKYSQGRISVFDVPNMVKNYVSPFPSVPTWKLLFSIK